MNFILCGKTSRLQRVYLLPALIIKLCYTNTECVGFNLMKLDTWFQEYTDTVWVYLFFVFVLRNHKTSHELRVNILIIMPLGGIEHCFTLAFM